METNQNNIPFLSINNSQPRTTYHRVPVTVGGRPFTAFLLRSINSKNKPERNTLVFTHIDEIKGFLPPGMYYYSITTQSSVHHGKMMLIR